ncbi:MAG: carboxypeptidase-like regulatory domain-containing protein [Acidobacteria bacterium]|nr:carboxypeptidase-like regulatory domain-containing protein [Acidobacteriota bacterium]MBI3654949.1 carboxypeptidase-like regulatory domain-containing protein [Acidobacteriota bacterium]
MNKRDQRYLLTLLCICFCTSALSIAFGYRAQPTPSTDVAITGQILDNTGKNPIAGATVYHNSKHTRTGADGRFSLTPISATLPVHVKAPGYRRAAVAIPNGSNKIEIRLTPFQAKGLYLTHFGVGDKGIRNRALSLLKETEMNALVIDVKGDRGYISFKSEVPMAAEAGALNLITLHNIAGFLEDLKKQNIYTIARIVVFKDNILANHEPRWAITDSRTKKPWMDNEHLAWVDPFREEIWKYNIDLAKEAAKIGFDEIQFDYIRFPTDGKVGNAVYAKPNNMENRLKAINGFLALTYKELLPYNVYFSIDIFGYVCWNTNDTSIGQRLEDVAQYADYLSPMVYPSAYHLGIPHYRNPVANPQEIVYYSLMKSAERLKPLKLPIRVRPWLQSFRDYAFDKRLYTATEIKAQISGATNAGACGWLLWDPRNSYTYVKEALKPPQPKPASGSGLGK